LSNISDPARHPRADDFGRVHILLACDYKQLPPATSRPPFIATDARVLTHFNFRVLRQNRRLSTDEDPVKQQALDDFHTVLENVAFGKDTALVRRFLIEAYVRGAKVTPTTSPFEGATACVTKRRYRNAWNKTVLERSAKVHKRSLKVKAVFLVRGTKNQRVQDSAATVIKRTVRSQALVNLRLAGQWREDPPAASASLSSQPHCMRAMLVSNVNVAAGFANGTIGRVVHWSPAELRPQQMRRPVFANEPDVQVRFYKEESLTSGKAHFLPEVDFMDLNPVREEVPTARGKPTMLQLSILPAYALTVHKVQALTIRNTVFGCLEGIFAHGQLYVLWSRVTTPDHMHAVGVPPLDLLEDVGRAWHAKGFNVHDCFEKAAAVTGEWEYHRHRAPGDPCKRVAERLQPKHEDLVVRTMLCSIH
jgi:hypothetical protein